MKMYPDGETLRFGFGNQNPSIRDFFILFFHLIVVTLLINILLFFRLLQLVI